MLITCKCLNICINAKNSEIQSVDVANLGLGVAEVKEPFFQEDIGTVELVRISKEQACLVQLRNVGNWVIHRCANCSTNTHAIHREKRAGCVIVSKNLLTDACKIAALRQSSKYSPVFKIIVNQSEEVSPLSTPVSPTKMSVLHLPVSLRTALASLQQQLAEVIQQEVAKTEEKVRLYTEQQYAALEEFREHAHGDHQNLVRLLCQSEENLSNVVMNNVGTPPMSPDSSQRIQNRNPRSPMTNTHLPTNNIVKTAATKQQTLSKVTKANSDSHMRQSNHPQGLNSALTNLKTEDQLSCLIGHYTVPVQHNSGSGSLDTEGLFDLEGMDDNPAEIFHSGEESDTDDSGSHDEGIHIPRQRAMPHLAKSLPVNVPTFLPMARGAEDSEDERDRHQPQDPMDIAASIKALAKSVHGDSNVFGDLPRPRFSTQL